MFANTDDIAQRLGRTLTAAETGTAEQMIEFATEIIATAVDRNYAWAESLDPVPKILKLTCVEMVARVLLNPEGLSSIQERLGQYSETKSYRGPNTASGVAGTGELSLTSRETDLLRRRFCRQVASARPETILDEIDRPPR